MIYSLKHQEFYTDKAVLVTGYTGFKGGWLTRTLTLLGSKVTGFSTKPEYQPNLDTVLGLSKEISAYPNDITDFSAMEQCIKKEKPELIFHLAAQISNSYENPISTYRTNLLGTLNVLEAARKSKSVKAIVIITTDKVYKNNKLSSPFRENDPLGGNDPYSSSKACVEVMVEALRESLFRNNEAPALATARAGNVIGGGDWFKNRIIPDIVKSIYEQKNPVEICNPDAVRPWQHILPIIDGYLLLGKKLYEDREGFSTSWNFSPEKENTITVKELVEKAIAFLGKGSYLISKKAATPGTKILKLNPSKAKKFLGWSNELPLEQALHLTFEWYQNYYEKKDMKYITDSQIIQFLKNDNYK